MVTPTTWNPDTASSDYWRTKIARNIERDRAADTALRQRGWTVIRMWDKDVKADLEGCVTRVTAAMEERGTSQPVEGVRMVDIDDTPDEDGN
jgi:DNA mismatch endonuclease (patch repair protein)